MIRSNREGGHFMQENSSQIESKTEMASAIPTEIQHGHTSTTILSTDRHPLPATRQKFFTRQHHNRQGNRLAIFGLQGTSQDS
jgi:hypothetical protein